MTFLSYQCKQCKRIIADENCILNLSKFQGIILMRAITGFTLDDEIQLSTEGDAAGCCFKNVYCECGNPLGKQIVSSPDGKDNLRHYWIDRSSIIDYSIKRIVDQTSSHHFTNTPNMFFLGADADRAASFLRELHQVERAVLALESRISKLEQSIVFAVFVNKQHHSIKQ